MNGLIAVYYELISQEIGSDGKESRKSILSLDYCLEIYLGYKTDLFLDQPSQRMTKFPFKTAYCMIRMAYQCT